MIGDVHSASHQSESRIKANKLGFRIQQAQESIYQFLLEIVRKQPPAKVLQEFKHLFIDYDACDSNPDILQSVSELIFANNEKEFRDTVKRSCYILINNWYISRDHTSIKELIELFSQVKNNSKTLSPTLGRQRAWLFNFINSPEYDELRLFVTKYEQKEHWSDRYTSYLLVPQYTNLTNPIEQREAARTLSQKLKEQFKFDLAMYTARSQAGLHKDKTHPNPTALGDKVLHFIKKIVAKNGAFNYENFAHIFLEQTREMNFKFFKYCFHKYLLYSIESQDFIKFLNHKLAGKLEVLYEIHHEEQVTDALLLRTCNRTIEYLTTEDHQEPSPLFILLTSQGHHLNLVIVLLKIILICPNARVHLETCIAKLIQYYTNYPEEECEWVINVFEIFKITFAIHADNVQYNLIKMNGQEIDTNTEADLDAYRVFSQLREYANLEEDEERDEG
ncbi:MAG TPA: hypothetical protein DC064_14815 [Cyanobacteria bacterium UBA9273]|nr:hypothetical protein [Cyanobacteria bacterium UBA9273]